jgi:hypothetical protein
VMWGHRIDWLPREREECGCGEGGGLYPVYLVGLRNAISPVIHTQIHQSHGLGQTLPVGVPRTDAPVYMRSNKVEVYYESIKREPKIRGINKCRCDERLQTFFFQTSL